VHITPGGATSNAKSCPVAEVSPGMWRLRCLVQVEEERDELKRELAAMHHALTRIALRSECAFAVKQAEQALGL
jgi:hypothetical protein